MTLTPERRTTLPLIDLPSTSEASHARGKRSAVTCALKCGNACLHPAPNTSDNEYFPDLVDRVISRRLVLGGSAVAAGLVLTSAGPVAASGLAERTLHGGGGLPFTPIAPVPNTVDAVTVPSGYRWDALIRWGDPVVPGAPEFDVDAQSERAQERQFGYNCDYLDVLPLDDGGSWRAPQVRHRGDWDDHGGDRRALLVVNHEYTNEPIMFPPTTDAAQIERNKRTAIAAHGMSIVTVERSSSKRPWKISRDTRRNRRITGMTNFLVDGPAAGDNLLKTKDDPTGTRVLGTLNNCSGGTTPWGTVLTAEENFNQYFLAPATPENARYGLLSTVTPGGNDRAWWTTEPRFNAQTPGYENEVNRFGWIVEVDPLDPRSTPVKHTALGRFKHEAANIRIAPNGQVVAYSGDDERFDYIYKFVSHGRYDDAGTTSARRRNLTLLSSGDLYVAKFTGDSGAEIDGTGKLPADGEFDGDGQWIPLVLANQSQVPGMSVAQVLVYTRLAGDAVGATKMDRPEDIEVNPKTGAVYAALTNNTNRGTAGRPAADEPNPRNVNRDGHVIELVERGNDPRATRFNWNLLLVCGRPEDPGTYFGGYDKTRVSPISCPDNVAFDSEGNLWISTDGQPGTIALDDALHKVTLAGPERGKVEQFLAVPREAETCGPVIRDEEGLVLVCVQHPGENGTWAAPTSYFPDYLPLGVKRRGGWGGPRPSVVQVYRD